jgi:hypothetical protein
MRNLSISAKLWLAVIGMVLALSLVVGFAALRNKQLQVESAQRTQALDERLDLAKEWQRLSDANVIRNTVLMLSAEPVVEQVFKPESLQTIEVVSAIQKKIEALDLSATEKAALDRVSSTRKSGTGTAHQGY